MRLIESYEDQMNGVVTYQLDDGRRIRVDERAAKEYGAARIIRESLGVDIPITGVAIYQFGKRIGTVPSDFEPSMIKSLSYFYDPRPGDFTRDASGWIAGRSLGRGDINAIPGFIRS